MTELTSETSVRIVVSYRTRWSLYFITEAQNESAKQNPLRQTLVNGSAKTQYGQCSAGRCSVGAESSCQKMGRKEQRERERKRAAKGPREPHFERFWLCTIYRQNDRVSDERSRSESMSPPLAASQRQLLDEERFSTQVSAFNFFLNIVEKIGRLSVEAFKSLFYSPRIVPSLLGVSFRQQFLSFIEAHILVMFRFSQFLFLKSVFQSSTSPLQVRTLTCRNLKAAFLKANRRATSKIFFKTRVQSIVRWSTKLPTGKNTRFSNITAACPKIGQLLCCHWWRNVC